MLKDLTGDITFCYMNSSVKANITVINWLFKFNLCWTGIAHAASLHHASSLGIESYKLAILI